MKLLIERTENTLQIERELFTLEIAPFDTGVGAIQENLGTAKGDLVVFNGTDWEKLAVGADGQALVADSGESGGLGWGAAGAFTTLTNKDTVELNPSDVVVQDEANDSAFKGTTTQGAKGVLGVLGEVIAVNHGGAVYTYAGTEVTINVTAEAVARGDTLITSTTKGRAKAGTGTGVFAVATTAKAAGAAGTVKAMLVKQSGGPYALEQATDITLLGGYMSTADKQAASWAITGEDTEPETNIYDGNTGTFVHVLTSSTLVIKVDFGSDVVLDQIDCIQSSSRWMKTFTVYGSDTGAWAGEEELVHSETKTTYSSELYFSNPAQYRYWRITGSNHYSTSSTLFMEINFHYGSTLALMGVPWGCEVELWNGSTSVDSQVSESLTKPGIVEFTAVVTSVDKMTITRPDGSTAWLEFDIDPDTGDVYSLFKDQ